MSKLFKQPVAQTNLGKNVFDLSQRLLHTQSAGQLLPTFCREVNPGEKVQISISNLVRTMPLNTAAFCNLTQYNHVFFVPFKQLWSNWDKFYTGVGKTQSSAIKGDATRIPALDLTSVMKRASSAGYWKGYSPHEYLTNLNSKELDVLGYRLLDGSSRLLDMLEYGMSVQSDSNVKLYNGSTATRPSSTLAEVFDDYVIGKDEKQDISKVVKYNYLVNPFRLLAYQKIYQDFYKRDDYENYDVSLYNIDDIDDINTHFNTIPIERIIGMLTLRYRYLPTDYFTNVVPSELYIPGNSRGLSDKGLDGISGSYEDGNHYVTSYNPKGEEFHVNGELGDTINVNSLDTRSIRTAFAFEKLLRKTRFASSQSYKDQIASHFGYTPQNDRMDTVTFLGGNSTSINISEVITSQYSSSDGYRYEGPSTETMPGQIFGKGFGNTQDNNNIEFEVPEHGIIMVISSIVPSSMYVSEGVSAFNNKLERGDYFMPEFDNLGYVPMSSDELYKPIGSSLEKSPNTILGFTPSYYEYKSAYDRMTGEFRNDRSLSAWSSQNPMTLESLEHASRLGFALKPSVGDDGSLASGLSNGLAFNKNSLFVNPSSLNRIYPVEFDGRINTDQFNLYSYMSCKIIRPMSYFSFPTL